VNSDYEGHSSFLHKCIADAVETGVEIRFVRHRGGSLGKVLRLVRVDLSSSD